MPSYYPSSSPYSKTENRREEGDMVVEKPEICEEMREKEGGGRDVV